MQFIYLKEATFALLGTPSEPEIINDKTYSENSFYLLHGKLARTCHHLELFLVNKTIFVAVKYSRKSFINNQLNN